MQKMLFNFDQFVISMCRDRYFKWITGLMILVIGCTSVEIVHTEKADNFRWDKYRTFDFFTIEASGDTVPETFERNIALLTKAIGSELREKGLTKASASPDLLINIGVVVQEKIQTRETNFREAPRYIGQRRYSWKSEKVEVARYKEGTVTVHLVDRESNSLVWEGTMEGVVPSDAGPAQISKTINKGMDKLFGTLK